jgi:hypothetical protein
MKLSSNKWSYVLLLLTSTLIAGYNLQLKFIQWHSRTSEDHLYDLIDLAYLSLVTCIVVFIMVVLPSALLINLLQKRLDSPVIASSNSELKYISSVTIAVCTVLIVVTILFWLNSTYMFFS